MPYGRSRPTPAHGMRFIAGRPRYRVAYSFEMVLVGAILLSAMAAGGIAMGIRRRREADRAEAPEDGTGDNSKNAPQ